MAAGQTLIDLFLADTEELYRAECTQIPVGSLLSEAGRDAYQPDTRDYFEDVSEEKATPGLVMAAISLIFFFALIIWSCVLCCSSRGVTDQSELEKIKQAQTRLSRFTSFVLVVSVVGLTLVVVAMAGWGIYETEEHVAVVVKRSFELVNDTEMELDWIYQNLSSVITNTQLVVGQLQTLGLTSDTIDKAQDALELADDVLDNHIDVYRTKARDVLGYEDEADSAEKALRAVLITSFVLMIIVSLIVCLYVVFLASPWGTLRMMIVLWLLLFIIFGFGVGFGTFAREVTEDTCLYMDDFAISEIEEAVSDDFQDRVNPLLRYYFQMPGGVNRSVEELQDLWDLPLDEFKEALDDAEDDLGGPVAEITDARGAIAFVELIIRGVSWRLLHADLVDLVCCTVYDAVDSLWIAYVTSAVACFFLGTIGTFQVIKAVWMSRPPTAPAVQVAVPTAKGASYYANMENGTRAPKKH
eukprot:evm.model.scf_467.1 EVM.evm.TU.scf_467.1   scf_467:3809-10939(+)